MTLVSNFSLGIWPSYLLDLLSPRLVRSVEARKELIFIMGDQHD